MVWVRRIPADINIRIDLWDPQEQEYINGTEKNGNRERELNSTYDLRELYSADDLRNSKQPYLKGKKKQKTN